MFIINKAHEKQNRLFGLLAKYTMPIYLAHTICAAGFSVALLKAGITVVSVHFIGGLIVSFVGPIAMMITFERFLKLDFFVYLNRYIKMERRTQSYAQQQEA